VGDIRRPTRNGTELSGMKPCSEDHERKSRKNALAGAKTDERVLEACSGNLIAKHRGSTDKLDTLALV